MNEVPEQEPAPEAETAPEPGSEEQPETSTKMVDMDGDTQKRFNKIYGNMKQYERVVGQMGRENRALLERLDKLEGSAYTAEVTTAIDGLKKQKVEALDNGDHEKVTDIDDKIAQIRAIPEPMPSPVSSYASEDATLSQQDSTLISEWGAERDDTGAYKRPWAQAGHPYNTKAAALGAAVLEDPAIVAQGTEAILAEVDRLMGGPGPTRVTRTSPVLTNDKGVTPPSTKAGKPTQDQILIAKAMDIPIDKYMKSAKEIADAR